MTWNAVNNRVTESRAIDFDDKNNFLELLIRTSVCADNNMDQFSDEKSRGNVVQTSSSCT